MYLFTSKPLLIYHPGLLHLGTPSFQTQEVQNASLSSQGLISFLRQSPPSDTDTTLPPIFPTNVKLYPLPLFEPLCPLAHCLSLECLSASPFPIHSQHLEFPSLACYIHLASLFQSIGVVATTQTFTEHHLIAGYVTSNESLNLSECPLSHLKKKKVEVHSLISKPNLTFYFYLFLFIEFTFIRYFILGTFHQVMSHLIFILTVCREFYY